ncbi:MAG: hypothetical protein NVSMB47_12870 [Polyangiales bacterium]
MTAQQVRLGRVLVVEDDGPIREAVEDVLREEGFVVTAVPSLAAARVALATSTPDAMLLDLMLEDGDGETLLGELRTAGLSLPTVVMSASTRARGSADEFGVELLRKPFELDVLIDVIRRACARSAR